MGSLKEFKIPFVGLKEGKHQFDFKIGKGFFDAFNYDEFDEVDFKVVLILNKRTTLLELDFKIRGVVRVPCDVTGEEFDLQVTGDLPLIVKFGEKFNNDNEELLILPHQAYEIEVQQYIYELIVLSIPQKRIKPSSSVNQEKQGLEEVEDQSIKNHKEQNDPRWDQLKQLLDKK